MDKPIIEQMQNSVPSTSYIKESATGAIDSITESISETKQSLQNSLDDFSNKSVVDAGKEFLDSNSLLAKFAFLVLVFIAFMVILKIAVAILGYFLAPSRNPYLVKGYINGNENVQIYQDPKRDDSVPIYKSNDRHRGIEFTWSSWIYLNKDQNNGEKHSPIFIKGVDNFDSTTGIGITNGPGLYVKETKEADGSGVYTQSLVVVMDHVSEIATNSTNLNDGRDSITVEDIPIQKWFHLAIRMQNMMMDIYVNGTIVKRHNMDKVPKQNFHDVWAGKGFNGKISNLRYYDRALNVFELNNIVMFGPDTTASKRSQDSSGKSGNYSYLSSMWYSAAHNN
jgi:hypothetical protein